MAVWVVGGAGSGLGLGLGFVDYGSRPMGTMEPALGAGTVPFQPGITVQNQRPGNPSQFTPTLAGFPAP